LVSKRTCFLLVVSLAFALPSASRTLQQPAISERGVANSADYSDGSVDGIARGSQFSIFGRYLAGTVGQAGGLPLATALHGVRVRIWVNAISTDPATEAPLLYVSPTQINAVVPSSIPEGSRSISVQVNGLESARAPTQVVLGRFAAFTPGGRGFGPAAMQQVDDSGQVSLNRFLNPARPGGAVVLWGTGLGPLSSGSDADAPVASDRSESVTVWVAGSPIKPFYAGRAPGQPGLDQINFFLPASLPERCYVPLVVQTGQTRSTMVTLAAASQGGTCRSEFGLSREALGQLENGGRIRIAVLSFQSETAAETRQSAEAWLSDYDASYLSGLATYDLPPVADGICSKREYSYTRNSPPPTPRPGPYGVPLRRVFDFPRAIRIQSSPGCAWSMDQGSDGVYRGTPQVSPCLASSYSFEGLWGARLTGTFPQPRPAIASFRVDRTGPLPRASWMINSRLPGDTVKVTAGSRFELSGNIFNGATRVRELSCGAAAEGSQLLLPGPDYEWALSLPQSAQTQMTLQAISHQLIPADASGPLESADFVLIRIRNGTTAVASPNR